MNNLVGVIGGLGPSATAYFMKLIIDLTKANCDQDNVDMLVCQYSSIPDRTSYILEKSTSNPAHKMIEAAKLLEREKCKFIVIPCNTASYFYDEIIKNVNTEVLNIAEVTSKRVLEKDPKKVGIMATDGTIISGVYDKYLNNLLFKPNQEIQNEIMSIIYDDVKRNQTPSKERFSKIINYFKENNCDYIITGCTELSVALIELNINEDFIIDSLTVLAKETILKAGKQLK